MKLNSTGRTANKKSEIKKIRHEGNIPAILYSKGEKGKEIVVDGGEFRKFLNTIEPGTLSSKVFTLDFNGKACKAVLKDIQYEVTTYNILHLDFAELHEGVPITLNIPIKCVNVVDCIGVKLGGAVRQIIRHLKVTCLPKNIPSHFELDVKNLPLGHSMKLADLSLPSTVKAADDLNQVAVIMARK